MCLERPDGWRYVALKRDALRAVADATAAGRTGILEPCQAGGFWFKSQGATAWRITREGASLLKRDATMGMAPGGSR
jgi:hypothetical protein